MVCGVRAPRRFALQTKIVVKVSADRSIGEQPAPRFPQKTKGPEGHPTTFSPSQLGGRVSTGSRVEAVVALYGRPSARLWPYQVLRLVRFQRDHEEAAREVSRDGLAHSNYALVVG